MEKPYVVGMYIGGTYSVFGILDSINKDYNTMNLDATEIQKKLADPENMALLRDVLAKLG